MKSASDFRLRQVNKTEKELLYLTFYLGIIHLLYLTITLLAGKKLPVFAIIDLVALYSIILTIRYFDRHRVREGLIRLTWLDCWVLLYISISILSVVFYLRPDNPATIKAYAYGLHLLIFPIFLYFSVKILSPESQKKLLKTICLLNIFFILYGFLMFYFQPEFFTNYLRNNLFSEQGVNDLWVIYSRVQSYFGSSAVGTISWVTLVLLMILDVKGVKRIFLFTCLVVAALLSQQRGGILGIILALIYFSIVKRESITKKIKMATIAILSIAGIVIFYSQKYQDVMPFNLVEYTTNRIVNEMFLGNPFDDRKISRDKGWEVICKFPFGLGAGANSSGADSAGANPGGQISDANFLRIWADLGIFGILAFVMIIAFALRSALRTAAPIAWGLIVAIYCIQGLGSNVFDNFYVSHLFWLLLGVMDSNPVKTSTVCRSSLAPTSNSGESTLVIAG